MNSSRFDGYGLVLIELGVTQHKKKKNVEIKQLVELSTGLEVNELAICRR